MRRVTDVPTVAASVALAAATVLLGSAVVRATTPDLAESVDPVPMERVADARPPVPVPPPTREHGLGEDGREAIPDDRRTVRVAVDVDPFNPARRPPSTRYRLPGAPEPVVARVEPEREAPRSPEFRVVGAAVIGQGGAALVHTEGGGPPRLLSVGESLMGYTLAAVDAEGATLVGAAGRLELPVTRGEFDRDDDDRRDRRRRGDDDDDDRRREAQMERQRMLQMRAIMQQVQAAQQRRSRDGGGGP